MNGKDWARYLGILNCQRASDRPKLFQSARCEWGKAMDLRIEITLDKTMVPARDELVQALKDEVNRADPTASLSPVSGKLGAFSAADPSLVTLVLHSLGNVDLGSLATGAGAGLGAGTAARTVTRLFKRLAGIARQFGRPLDVRVGGSAAQLPPDASPGDVERIIKSLSSVAKKPTAEGRTSPRKPTTPKKQAKKRAARTGAATRKRG